MVAEVKNSRMLSNSPNCLAIPPTLGERFDSGMPTAFANNFEDTIISTFLPATSIK